MIGVGDIFGGRSATTFMGLPAAVPADVGGASVAILGADTATPYSIGAYAAGGAAALRRGAAEDAGARGHWSFDTETVALPDGVAVDCGDLPVDPGDGPGNRALIEATVRDIVGQGAVPVLIGGDDSVPIPVIAGLGPEPLWIVQVDAHIDWREEIEGERFGLSSTMRRASEMGHVEGIIQIGQRGIGSARPGDVMAAKEWGVHFIGARALDEGADPLAALPQGARVCLVFDFDGLDPSIMPAVLAPTAGGLTYWQAFPIVQGIEARARLVGVTMAEFVADRDIGGLGAVLGAQLLTAWIGTLAKRAARIG